MKSKFNKLFVTILLVVAVTCCGAFGVLAADNTDEAAAAASTTETTETNTDNDHNSSLSIGLVAAALATGLAGIGGGMAVASVARSEADLRQALENAAKQPDIAVLLVTEKIAETYTEVLDSARAKGTPLLITVPSTGGGAAGKDRLTRYIREAIGVKI